MRPGILEKKNLVSFESGRQLTSAPLIPSLDFSLSTNGFPNFLWEKRKKYNDVFSGTKEALTNPAAEQSHESRRYQGEREREAEGAEISFRDST